MPPDAPSDGAPLSRAELRKARQKERRRRHRWRRRILYALTFIVLLGVGGAAGLYFYVGYRFDQIKKVHAKHLIKEAAPGKPFDLLLVGSDSRSFVDNSTQVRAFGNQSDAGGQRSDVTMVARFVPATKTVTVLSIPRDLWVDIPQNSGNIEGMNRINAAYNTGPDLLVETIEKDLHIPVNHFMAVNFPGFLGMVNALGGITMDFSTPVRDAFTGLDVLSTGCQVVNGTVALQIVRARHLEYVNSNGEWEYDGLSDFSRIQRQDQFFRAVLQKVNASITNPLAINGFISAAVGNVTIDDTLSKTDLFHIATEFKGLAGSHLVTETLPTNSFTTDGGADVLEEAQPYANQMIAAFNRIGVPKPKPSTTTTTTTSPLPIIAPGNIDVQVLNAAGVTGLAGTTATALTSAGFDVTEVADAPTLIAAGDPSQIWYGPNGQAAAHSLGADLSGGSITYVYDSDLNASTVSLLVASAQLNVTGPNGTGTTTTTTTTPGETTTTTTIPSDVYTNTQSEPWNPVPCTLGPTTPPTSTPKLPKTTKTTKAASAASRSS